MCRYIRIYINIYTYTYIINHIYIFLHNTHFFIRLMSVVRGSHDHCLRQWIFPLQVHSRLSWRMAETVNIVPGSLTHQGLPHTSTGACGTQAIDNNQRWCYLRWWEGFYLCFVLRSFLITARAISSNAIRRFVSIHYALVPYLLSTGSSALESNSSSILPLAKHDSFIDKLIDDFHPATYDYMLGKEILVAPVTSNTSNVKARTFLSLNTTLISFIPFPLDIYWK